MHVTDQSCKKIIDLDLKDQDHLIDLNLLHDLDHHRWSFIIDLDLDLYYWWSFLIDLDLWSLISNYWDQFAIIPSARNFLAPILFFLNMGVRVACNRHACPNACQGGICENLTPYVKGNMVNLYYNSVQKILSEVQYFSICYLLTWVCNFMERANDFL